jgi:hypothetical protein
VSFNRSFQRGNGLVTPSGTPPTGPTEDQIRAAMLDAYCKIAVQGMTHGLKTVDPKKVNEVGQRIAGLACSIAYHMVNQELETISLIERQLEARRFESEKADTEKVPEGSA